VEFTGFQVGAKSEMMKDIRTDEQQLHVGYATNPWDFASKTKRHCKQVRALYRNKRAIRCF